MALFLLLFVCLDIAVPPPCAEASKSLSASSDLLITVVIDRPSSDRAVAANDCHSSPSPEETCRDEDCCFGCAHLLPHMPLSNMTAFDAKSASWIVADQQVASSPVQGPYHPPRFI
jgi:hypothetical protein